LYDVTLAGLSYVQNWQQKSKRILHVQFATHDEFFTFDDRFTMM